MKSVNVFIFLASFPSRYQRQPFSLPPKPKVRYCLFCNEPQSTKRIFVGDRFWIICENCIAEAAAIVADQRKARLGAPQHGISRPPAGGY
jgi:hypothetical protein